MQPINVMHVFVNLELGGAQRIFLTTAAHVRRERFNFILCCLGKPGALVPEAQAQGHEIIILNRLQSSNDLGAIWALARLMRRRRVQVVQSFLYSRASLYARLAALLVSVPVVIAAEMGPVGERSLKKRLADRFLSLVTDHFVALSKATKVQTTALQSVASKRVSVIYPGVDPSQFTARGPGDDLRRSLSIAPDAPVIGVVARLDPVKGHVHLLDAIPQVLTRFPGSRLLIVGTGSAEGKLVQRVASLGLSKAVIFTGARRDIPQLLKAMDLFVLPSLHEGFGFALLEAMACCLPVVATEVGGIPEVVQDGQTGLLVPPADPSALAEAIIRLLEDETTRTAMGRAGHDRVMARFTVQRTAEETERLYERLLHAKGIHVPPARGDIAGAL